MELAVAGSAGQQLQAAGLHVHETVVVEGEVEGSCAQGPGSGLGVGSKVVEHGAAGKRVGERAVVLIVESSLVREAGGIVKGEGQSRGRCRAADGVGQCVAVKDDRTAQIEAAVGFNGPV